MSKDIRSYFTTTSRKPVSAPLPSSSTSKNSKAEKVKQSPPNKRKVVEIIDSDSDEEIFTKSQNKKEENSKSAKIDKKKRRIISSDDENDVKPSKKAEDKEKLGNSKKKDNDTVLSKKEPKKIVDASSIFGSVPKRVEKEKPKTKEKPVEDFGFEINSSDDEFDKSIADLNENQLIKKQGTPKKAKETLSKSPRKDTTLPNKKEKAEKTSHAKESPRSSSSKRSNNEAELKSPKTPKTSKLSSVMDVEKKVSNSPDSTVKIALSDEERHERKRAAAVLYQQFKNRQSVLNPGCKEIPKGKPNCLAGLSFLVTGVLESLEREDANQLIKDHGGRISTTVGKRLNYMVVGQEAGPKKVATATELGVNMITEDELFDLIRGKSSNGESKEKKSPKQKEVEKNKNIDKHPKKRELPKPDSTTKISPKKAKMEKIESSEIVKTVEIPSNEFSKADLETLSWVDKYKPTNVKQIVGQQGPASCCAKLTKWMSNWYENHSGNKKLQKPNPWAKNDDGSYYKAALLSGGPGIGKTTTATLVCKSLGFDIVEFNASDTRSKKLLHVEVSELLRNKSLYGFMHGENAQCSKKHCLIMDEVDGMAGNEDRGGIQELISLIKSSSVPIICMCNDRNHPKMRSLLNYCYDLRFNRPTMQQIKALMLSICCKEEITIPTTKIEEIISASNQDIRQAINYIFLLKADKIMKTENDSGKAVAKKDLKLGPWDVVRKVFSEDLQKGMSLYDKSDLFFHDYSLGPLFVQQNYLSVLPHVPKNEIMERVALAADSLSLGDLVDKKIRSNSAWSLLPTQAMFSSVLPGEYMSGHFTGQINFPAWLGKNSRVNKRSRLAQEIHDHTRFRTSGSRLSVRLDYVPFLLDAIVRPLRKGLDGVEESLKVIKEYHLLREDIESLMELASWPGKRNPMDAVDSKVKAALTRAYNKEVLAYTYSVSAGVKKKKNADDLDPVDDLNTLENEEGEVQKVVVDDEEVEEDNLDNDALIKVKKKTSTKPGTSSSSKASSTKTKGTKKK